MGCQKGDSLEPDLKKYHSELTINIFGDIACEYDEPSCSLMLCETICFMRKGHIVGVDLLTDKDFLESLELLIKNGGEIRLRHLMPSGEQSICR